MDISLSSLLVGVAIGAIGAFGTGFLSEAGKDLWGSIARRFWPQHKDNNPQVVIQLDSSAKDSESSTSHLASSSIERVSPVTFHEIEQAIEKAPPMQRDRVAEAYQGIRVEWDSYFRGGDAWEEETIRVRLSVEEKFVGRTIICVVPAKEYRELGVLPEGTKIRVSGEISRARSYEVELRDVRLQFFPGQAQA